MAAMKCIALYAQITFVSIVALISQIIGKHTLILSVISLEDNLLNKINLILIST